MSSSNPITTLALSAALSLTALAGVAALTTAGSAAGRPRVDAAARAAAQTPTPKAAAQERPLELELPLRVRARQRMASISPFGAVAPPPPEALPADPTVRTRAGEYATRAQAEALAAELEGEVIWAVVDGCDSAAIDIARGLVYGEMAAQDLSGDTPVFVSGNDARAAVRLVDLLSDEGLTRVYLVTR